MRRIVSIVFFLSLSACGSSASSPPLAPAGDDGGVPSDSAPTNEAGVDPRFDEIASFFESELKASDTPGGAVAIVVDGKLAFTKGLGLRRRGTDEPVTPNTRFRVASVTKMVTASLVMKLVDEGAIDLAKTAVSYAPEIAFEPKEQVATITLDQVLTHTGGLPDGYTASCDTTDDGLTKWFAANAGMRLWVEPGKVWDYSNIDYSVAALVAEKAGKKPYAALLKEKILDPLGMTSTFDTKEVAAGDYAVGYAVSGDKSRPSDPTKNDCAASRPYGFLFASVVDLAHFAEMLVGGRKGVLSVAAIANMSAPHVETHMEPGLSYGYGLMQSEYKGLHVVHHDGGIPGFRTHVWTIPEKKFAVVAFVNGDAYDPAKIGKHATDTFFGLPAGVPTIPKPPASTFPKYAGKFHDDAFFGDFEVYAKDDKLWMKSDGADPSELLPYMGDTFAVNIGTQYLPATFYFDTSSGETGKPSYFVTRVGVGTAVTTMMSVYTPPKKLTRADWVFPSSEFTSCYAGK